MRTNGTAYHGETALDEVALPILLAWSLARRAKPDWDHVRQAADYIAAHGPRTAQDRWATQSGWSPNTIATAIAGLVCAADVARANGAAAVAAGYEALADQWRSRVDGWTATSTGPYAPKPYYVRVTKDGDPNAATAYDLGDNQAQPVDQRAVPDQGFLALALLGVKSAQDATIRNSLAVGDQRLKVDTRHGPMWYRFTSDGYGETQDGSDWELFAQPRGQTLGRLWPLLTAERGEYELLAGRSAIPQLRTLAGAANEGLLLPEQVWDGRRPTYRPGFKGGEGTHSATPFAWAHAQFVRLAWSIDAGQPFERPLVVACRYTLTGC
jgi:glucoamylase